MYSMDKDSNKDNPWTPAEDFPMKDQFLYRFSALEEAVRSGFRRLDERMDRMQSEVHDRNLEQVSELNAFKMDMAETIRFKRARIDGLEKRVIELETWSKVVTARFAVFLGVVTIVWTVLSPIIRNALGISNG